MSVGCREEPTKVLGEKGGGEPEQYFSFPIHLEIFPPNEKYLIFSPSR